VDDFQLQVVSFSLSTDTPVVNFHEYLIIGSFYAKLLTHKQTDKQTGRQTPVIAEYNTSTRREQTSIKADPVTDLEFASG